MTKIWTALVSLRSAHPNNFTYSDPLPPPTTMPVYNTRRGALNQDGVPVGHSAQLVAVVLDLIDGLMMGGSKTLKVEIDKGINEVRDITKRGKEAIARENERWMKEKARLGTTKPVCALLHEVGSSPLTAPSACIASDIQRRSQNSHRRPREGSTNPHLVLDL